MEAKKKQYYSNNRTSYIDGNTVRKLNAVPERRREERPTEAPRPRRQVQRQPRGLSNMNFASLVVLVAAIVATLYMCVNFLQLQTAVSRMEKSIKTYETSLKNLTNENDAAYAAINQAYDLNYVYKIAVEELGMVYPNNNEVITYEGSDLEYVRQYEDIPD